MSSVEAVQSVVPRARIKVWPGFRKPTGLFPLRSRGRGRTLEFHRAESVLGIALTPRRKAWS